MIAEIQVVPHPPGDDTSAYRHVEAAIAVLAASGVRYEVGALGTTLEGDPDVVWPLLRRAHDAVLASGARSVVTVLKVFSAADGPGMDDLVRGHR